MLKAFRGGLYLLLQYTTNTLLSPKLLTDQRDDHRRSPGKVRGGTYIAAQGGLPEEHRARGQLETESLSYLHAVVVIDTRCHLCAAVELLIVPRSFQIFQISSLNKSSSASEMKV